jgi:hypothetical protein
MTNSPEPNRNYTSRGAKKRNRLNIQSVHAPKPVKKTLSRAAKQAELRRTAAPPKKTNNRRRNLIIAISSITLVVVLIIFAIYYMITIAPMQRVLLTVGGENVSTDYFLKRAVAGSNGNINTLLISMEQELIIKQQAPKYQVAQVTAQEIDTYLRNQASTALANEAASNAATTTTAPTGTTTTSTTTTTTTTPTTPISDADFNKWFKQQLSNTGLSASEYREVTGRGILREHLISFLTTDVPSAIKQIHLWAIGYNSQAAATAAKAKIDTGTDWSTMAKSAATALGLSNNTDGDLGWWPEAAVPPQLAASAKTLETTLNICSEPIAYQVSDSSTSSGTATRYVLLKVSEISTDPMPITADQLTMLKNNALSNWLQTQLQGITIILHNRNGTTVDGLTSTVDNETSTWLNYQVQRLLAKRPTENTTTSLISTTTATTTTTTGTSP